MPPEKRLGFWCYIHVESFVGLLKLLVMGLLKKVSTPSLGEAFIFVFSRWKSLASSMILLARRCNYCTDYKLLLQSVERLRLATIIHSRITTRKSEPGGRTSSSDSQYSVLFILVDLINFRPQHVSPSLVLSEMKN